MLNELYALSKAISGMNIQIETWHREYKQLPKATAKAPCLRIWVSKAGTIEGIDELHPDTVQKLRKFGNNQASFPAFNIKPLYRITDEQQKKKLEEMRKDPSLLRLEALEGWFTNDNWRKSLKNIDSTMQDMSNRLLATIIQFGDGGGQVLTRLIQSANHIDGGLRAALNAYAVSMIEKTENPRLLLQILFHSGDGNKAPADDMGSNISVILDSAEWEDFGYPVASEETTLWMNSVLMRADETESHETDEQAPDAFGSPYDTGWSEPMPSAKLPGFDVTLRAMFHEQRCQQRYGVFNDGSYPISKENRAATKQALEWMAMQEHEGITWKRADKDEIAFAYPSELTQTPLKYASMLGPTLEDASDHAKMRFENCAKDFLKAFSALSPNKQPQYIRFFSIQKMDRARSKVVLTRNCTPQWFLCAAESWQQGCRNIPNISYMKPIIPFPLEVPKIVNAVWKRDGNQVASGRTSVKRMQPYQGMELLLDPTSPEATRYYLNILLSNAEGLISCAGNRYHGSNYASPYHAEHIANILAVLGLLLHKNDCIKEVYMKNMAFLVGQLLKACDELHYFYCMVERDRDVPPQLAGNSVFAAASATPHMALAQLSLRMKPYVAWAKRYRTLDTNKNGIPNYWASWCLNLLEDISETLSQTLSEPARFNDYEKAQFFLGYLAALPRREKDKNDLNADSNNNCEEEKNHA